MKKDRWIVWIIVAFTSLTTVALLADGSIFGLVRGIISAVILDGLIAYWDDRRVTLTNERQRSTSNVMMWAGVGMLLFMGVGYGVRAAIPANVRHTLSFADMVYTATVDELVFLASTVMIGSWVVLTLAAVLYLRQIDPETKKTLELAMAHEQRAREEMQAYRTALAVTARTIGTEKAIKLFRLNLEEMDYQPGQIDELVSRAETEIRISRGETIPVDMRTYHANANPTKPPTVR